MSSGLLTDLTMSIFLLVLIAGTTSANFLLILTKGITNVGSAIHAARTSIAL